MSSDLSHLSKVPDHVPDELVVEYNLLTGETLERCPQMLPVEHQDRPVLFSPLHGGFWVLTRYKEVREALQDAETFGQVGTIPRMPNPHPNIPNSLDPPELLQWRQLMLPLFAPKRVAALEPVYREIARERLDLIAPKGHCEFVAEYAQVLPVWRFCKQLGLPADRSQEFAEIVIRRDLRPHPGGDDSRRRGRREVQGRSVRKDLRDHDHHRRGTPSPTR